MTNVSFSIEGGTWLKILTKLKMTVDEVNLSFVPFDYANFSTEEEYCEWIKEESEKDLFNRSPYLPGLSIQAMDSAMVSITSLSLPSSFFGDTFYASAPATIGIKLEEMVKNLKGISVSGKTLQVNIVTGNTTSQYIQYVIPRKKTGIIMLKYPLYEIQQSPLDVSGYIPCVTAQFSSKGFHSIIKVLESMKGNGIKISTKSTQTEKCVELSTKGDNGECVTTLRVADAIDTDNDEEKDVLVKQENTYLDIDDEIDEELLGSEDISFGDPDFSIGTSSYNKRKTSGGRSDKSNSKDEEKKRSRKQKKKVEDEDDCLFLESYQSTYSEDLSPNYLLIISTPVGGDKITMYFSDGPVGFQQNIGDYGRLLHFLAPKTSIEDEENYSNHTEKAVTKEEGTNNDDESYLY